MSRSWRSRNAGDEPVGFVGVVGVEEVVEVEGDGFLVVALAGEELAELGGFEGEAGDGADDVGGVGIGDAGDGLLVGAAQGVFAQDLGVGVGVGGGDEPGDELEEAWGVAGAGLAGGDEVVVDGDDVDGAAVVVEVGDGVPDGFVPGGVEVAAGDGLGEVVEGGR
jgi:hypothetical protein